MISFDYRFHCQIIQFSFSPMAKKSKNSKSIQAAPKLADVSPTNEIGFIQNLTEEQKVRLEASKAFIAQREKKKQEVETYYRIQQEKKLKAAKVSWSL